MDSSGSYPLVPGDAMYTRRVLERLKVASQVALPGDLFTDSLALTAMEDHFFDQLLFRLQAEVLADKLADEKEEIRICFPATWFQHLKQALYGWRGMPRWVIERFPPKMEVHKNLADFKRYRTYPECNIVFPKEYGAGRIYEVLYLSGWKREKGQ